MSNLIGRWINCYMFALTKIIWCTSFNVLTFFIILIRTHNNLFQNGETCVIYYRNEGKRRNLPRKVIKTTSIVWWGCHFRPFDILHVVAFLYINHYLSWIVIIHSCNRRSALVLKFIVNEYIYSMWNPRAKTTQRRSVPRIYVLVIHLNIHFCFCLQFPVRVGIRVPYSCKWRYLSLF